MKLLFLDVETTGLTTKHGVIQLAGAVMYGEQLLTLEKFDFTCRPFNDDLIDDDALAIHGHSRGNVAAFLSPGAVFEQFVGLLRRHKQGDKLFLAGYNASFDRDHLIAWMGKCLADYHRWFRSIPLDVASVVISYCQRTGVPLTSMKLADVCKQFDVPLAKAHDAAADIAATVELYRRVM